jgi:hypothetical protein
VHGQSAAAFYPLPRLARPYLTFLAYRCATRDDILLGEAASALMRMKLWSSDLPLSTLLELEPSHFSTPRSVVLNRRANGHANIQSVWSTPTI